MAFDVNSLADELQSVVRSTSPTVSLPHPIGPQQVKLLYSVLSGLSDGIAIADTAGSLLVSNPAMQQMLDLDQKGTTLEDWPKSYGLYLPDNVTECPLWQFPLQLALRGQAAGPVELFLRNNRVPRGLWVHASGRPLQDEAGRVWGGILTFRDLTEHRQLEKEILDISGREQRRIGQDLHDGLCQILTGIRFMCSASLRRIVNKTSPEATEWIEIQKMVGHALQEADSVAKGLYPVELELNGLIAALRDLAAKTRKLYRISCVCICDKPVVVENRDVAIHIYRIVQEAIANAIKHGHAKNIMIWLTPIEKKFLLIVKNDGQPSEQPRRQGMGWRIMNDRAELIGATLRFLQDTSDSWVLTCEFQDMPLESKETR